MSKKRDLGTGVVLGLLWSCAYGGSVVGQEPAPGGAPVQPCSNPAIKCPSPIATDTYVHINLQPDGNSVCRFDPRTIEDLNTSLGGNVAWSFCSTCQTAMKVQLDVPSGSGPFDRFTVFVPLPTADNLVTVDVPCNGYGHASGFNATGSGDWKYFLRARPAGSTSFPDEIDPRLEIDDRGFAPPRPMSPWLERVLLVLAGLLAGAYIVRRMQSRPQPR